MKDTFKDYLKDKGLTKASVQSYLWSINKFFHWLKSEDISVESLEYSQALRYVKHLKNRGLKQRTIIHYIGVVKSYYHYLVQDNQLSYTPFARLELRSGKRQRLRKTLEVDLLEALYQNYPKTSPENRRDRMILGLLVYQGLHTTDLKSLTTDSIDLTLGKVTILETTKTATRTLNLNPIQILALKQYLEEDRQQIHQVAYHCKQLFFSSRGKLTLRNTLTNIIKTLRKLHPAFTTLQTIRNTCITYWIQTEGLRKAQYKAGHRYISSTEAYKPIKDDSLFTMVSQFHPIR